MVARSAANRTEQVAFSVIQNQPNQYERSHFRNVPLRGQGAVYTTALVKRGRRFMFGDLSFSQSNFLT
jgi:hypothetical protein